MDYQALQANFRRYIQLTDEEAQYFFSLLKPQKLKARRLLLDIGDPCLYFSLVTEGCLVNYYTDDNGFEHVLQFATTFWWTADLQSLMNGTPSMYTIKAVVDSEVLRLSRADMELLYQQIPKFERYFRIIFQNALMSHQTRIMQNIAYPAEERYRQFQQTYPHIEQLVPQKYIASYLGITPEFLSKIRRKMAKK
ncbi:MAG: Crp/Fnr family transcriptional regulator [Lewinellaceae bacterium]|nr:Crp/Fnr family transcriptional regulator [Lewinellaceae bacterium]